MPSLRFLALQSLMNHSTLAWVGRCRLSINKKPFQLNVMLSHVARGLQKKNTLPWVMQGAGHRVDCGDVDAAWPQCAHVVEGEVRIGGQEHFYLEPQGSVVLPGENSEMLIISSTQVRYAKLFCRPCFFKIAFHTKPLP